ncbi:fructosamine kinase family protein [Roseimaritima sediminicola]|uniref:fructosamine kinase family protein n=1 Tax=Roseimaritima sediminicola TaxID=2662066 RepID=UPI0013868223|nr:fructosamine kinase family protein [Roseimaritima sediminicola]
MTQYDAGKRRDTVTGLNPGAVLAAAGRDGAGLDGRSLVCSQPVSGGCISDTAAWQLDNGGRVFVKADRGDRLAMLRGEAEGLAALAATETIRVPELLAVGLDEENQRAFLVCEFIDVRPAGGGDDFFRRFGRRLADLHRARCDEPTFGWSADNHLGGTPQKNSPSGDWPTFFRDQRLEPQLRMAAERRLASPRLEASLERILADVPSLLEGCSDRPALIHGDLWSGNYLQDEAGEPVLVDPAIYRADREAEFGMLRLFGGCGESFYQAYDEAFPLAGRWQQRTDLYQLYHLLNHLNLFGGSYAQQCEQLAERIRP